MDYLKIYRFYFKMVNNCFAQKRIPATTVKNNPHIRQNIDLLVNGFTKYKEVILCQKSLTEMSGIITFLI